MAEIDRISDLARRVYTGEAWHGPALVEVLEGVDAAKAAERPIPGAHTIWEIVLHLAAWKDEVRNRIEGKPVGEPAEGDWPEVSDTSEAAWQASLALLGERAKALRDAIARYPESSLDEQLNGSKASAYFTIQGVIHHEVYHAAQIALLRKA